MIALFCDIDNTLIFSHRRALETEKRVAEMLDGAVQGYMTERTFRFLSACRSVSVIPVTSRSMRQYERVKGIFDSFNCAYALVLNGAILLRGGAVDEAWLEGSKKLARGAAGEMDRAARLLEEEGSVTLRYRDEFLLYGSAPDPEGTAKWMGDRVDESLVRLFFDGRKVYCAPADLTKGEAVRRLMRRIAPERSLAVGDSENDISMLECVDIPIVPRGLEERISNPGKVVVPPGRVLSDAACDVLEGMLEAPEG